MRARGGARLACGCPERLVAFLAPLPEHRAVSDRQVSFACQRGIDDRLQPGVVERYLVQVGIGASATWKGDCPMLGPELAEPARRFGQLSFLMIASAT